MKTKTVFKPWDVVTFCGDPYIVTQDFGNGSGYVREVSPSDQYPFNWRFEGEDVVLAQPHITEDVILWDIQGWISMKWARSCKGSPVSDLVDSGRFSSVWKLYVDTHLPDDVDALVLEVARYCPLAKSVHGTVTTRAGVKTDHSWVNINGEAYDFAKSVLLKKFGESVVFDASNPRTGIETEISYMESSCEV